jgi:hypothetical protein
MTERKGIILAGASFAMVLGDNVFFDHALLAVLAAADMQTL